MLEFEAYEIDGTDFMVLEKLELDGEVYLYLANAEDEEDVMFRKFDKNDPEYLIPLDNEAEVIKVAKALNEKK